MTDKEWAALKAKIAGHTGAAWEARDQNGPAAAFGCVASVGIFSHAKLAQAQARLEALGDDAEDDDDPMDSAWVCGIWGSLTAEDRANAALIAAAPTLVAELERLREALADIKRQAVRSGYVMVEDMVDTALTGSSQ